MDEIILYQPDSTVRLEVRLEGDTVWLNRHQIATLFDRDVKTIGKHINNALKEELDGIPVVAKFATTAADGKTYQVEYYNIEMITSIGYRVKSSRGIQFRTWANKILKEYLLRGYSISQRLIYLENRLDLRLTEHEKRIDELSDKVDFFVKTSLPPVEGIFFDGQIFDAYALMCDLIRSAKKRIVIVDNYVDDSVLKQLDKRADGVAATIYTSRINRGIHQDILRHNSQYPTIKLKYYQKAHDRFMIVDDTVYHIGASFKDLGKKLFAFSKMEVMSADELVKHLEEN
ncbi:MAG: virulence RhuM family protein [Paramuribaculum sp.]|nr:virulence RhuM family protein [Paramuribaculum sp.]